MVPRGTMVAQSEPEGTTAAAGYRTKCYIQKTSHVCRNSKRLVITLLVMCRLNSIPLRLKFVLFVCKILQNNTQNCIAISKVYLLQAKRVSNLYGGDLLRCMR